MTEPVADLQRWRTLHDKFQIVDNRREKLSPPSADLLRHFESETGVRLPKGYRDFLQVFGPGELRLDVGDIWIYSPYCKSQGLDLEESVRSNARLTPHWLYPERVRRLVYFARNVSGDQFGWDPEEVTNSEGYECRIYAWIRGDEDDTKFAESFAGFLRLCFQRVAYAKVLRLKTYEEEMADTTWDFAEFEEEYGEEASRKPGAKPRLVFHPV